MATTLTDPIDVRVTDGDLVIPVEFVAGTEAVAQMIRLALTLVRGEWILDRSAGLPLIANAYVTEREALLARPFDAARWRAEVRRVILAVPHVNAITSLVVTQDPTTRRVLVTCKCNTAFGVAAATQEIVTP